MSMVKNEILGLDFGDKRLNNRYEQIIARIEKDSKSTFPSVAKDWAWLKGFYRFFNNKKVKSKEMIKTHIKSTVKRCEGEKIILVIQDTTVINLKSANKIEGLGYTDDHKKKKGFLVHSTMAVSGESGKPLGILNQQVIVRKKFYDRDEGYKERLNRKKESDKWKKGAKETNKLLKVGGRIIHVSDRESDIYFYIKDIIEAKNGFVIRASQNRITEEGYLFDTIREAEYKGEMEIKVPKKGGRKGRETTVKIYSRQITMIPPKVINHIGERIKVNIVYVEEDSKKEDRIEWLILTSEPVDTLEDTKKIIWYYKNRWQIEEFHKGLKTGCGIEERQLSTREQHEKLLSMFSILAWNGLLLRYNARIPGNKDLVLDSVKIEILKERYPELKEEVDAQKILRAVAMLGGFIGRKSDGNPGWQKIILGLTVLEYLKQGFLLGRKTCG